MLERFSFLSGPKNLWITFSARKLSTSDYIDAGKKTGLSDAQAVVLLKTVENEPTTGLKIEKEFGYRVTDPRGFTVTVDAKYLVALLVEAEVVHGEVKTPCIWTNQGYPIVVSGEKYKDDIKRAEFDKAKPKKEKVVLEPGRYYSLKSKRLYSGFYVGVNSNGQHVFFRQYSSFYSETVLFDRKPVVSGIYEDTAKSKIPAEKYPVVFELTDDNPDVAETKDKFYHVQSDDAGRFHSDFCWSKGEGAQPRQTGVVPPISAGDIKYGAFYDVNGTKVRLKVHSREFIVNLEELWNAGWRPNLG